MKLVNEDEYGAYSGVREEFLKKFISQENNPNFEVYNSRNNHTRFIAVKSSRIPDDQDLAASRYGIDFNRAKPQLREALQYGAELPSGYQWLGDIAFAAATKEEYERKSAVWDKFYSYIWDFIPQTVWVAPHSGIVNRSPDNIIAFPKLWIDNNTAGVAALCAFKDRSKPSKRIMVAIHSTGQLGAILNLGDFGVIEQAKMDFVANKMEKKYHEKAQVLADEFKQDFCTTTIEILEHIIKKRGTLSPEKLNRISQDDSFRVRTYAKCLKIYGQEIKGFTLKKFKESLENLKNARVPVILNNHLYPARKVGKLLKLSEKIDQGLLHSALCVEGAKLYMDRDPEFVVDIILDVKNELFG